MAETVCGFGSRQPGRKAGRLVLLTLAHRVGIGDGGAGLALAHLSAKRLRLLVGHPDRGAVAACGRGHP